MNGRRELGTAGEGSDGAGGVEAVSLDEIGTDGPQVGSTILGHITELALEIAAVGGGGAGGQGYQGLVPGSGLDVPEVHSAHVGNIEGCHFSQEERSHERGDEGDARGFLVG